MIKHLFFCKGRIEDRVSRVDMLKPHQKAKVKTDNVNLYYGSFHALKNITIDIPEHAITAIIGPSGCGKSSLLRIFNRMNDLIPIARVEGNVYLDDIAIYDKNADLALIRKRVGIVFQKPNPFPMSIYDNVTFGPRFHRVKDKNTLNEIVNRTLSQVGLWDEVKDNLKRSSLDLSAEQQQRLCIARTLAGEPDVILFDESCSALDPQATARIEGLMIELKQKYTIVIVTHSMEQALRISDMSAFMMIDDNRAGTLVEYSSTKDMFTYPKDKRTEDYITGRYG